MNKWKKYTLFSVTCWSLVFQLNWSIYETGSLACPYNLPAGGRCYFTTQPPNDYFQTYHCPVFLSAVSCHWLLISSWEIIHQSAHRASFLYIPLSDAHKALISLSNKRSRDWKPVAFLFSPAHLSLHVVCQVVIFKKATSQPGMIVLTLAVSTDHSWSGQTGMVSLY